jgi:hypothetical protein
MSNKNKVENNNSKRKKNNKKKLLKLHHLDSKSSVLKKINNLKRLDQMSFYLIYS